ncbi:hypothetical protein BDR26DRAFT_1006562 [Obelidium mucronatum]|nr:hypothetical protein BDR26DRAFT_1006562 [Obelidium mucronatum]
MDSAKHELTRYLVFMRKQRLDATKELRLTLKEVADRRIVDTTYNEDDVRDILHDATVNCEATFLSEGMLQSHMNFLLIQQYLNQAGEKGLELVGDMKELEDRTRLASVAEFEDNLLTGNNQLNLLPTTVSVNPPETDRLKDKIADLEKALEDLKMNAMSQRSEKNETIEMQKTIKILTQRVKSLESDLDDRIDKSVPVQNMKKMLMQKNELLKEYRSKLSKLDPSFLS